MIALLAHRVSSDHGFVSGGEHEERKQGNGDSGSGHVAALISSPSVAPSTSMSHPGESDGDDESYDDDDEWEDEDEVPDEDDPHATAENRTGQGRGGDRDGLGPLALERSFRESFASVNGILSVMAGKAIPAASPASPSLASIGGSCANSSSGSGAVPGAASNTGSTTSGRLAAMSKHKIGTESSSSHQSAERDRGGLASPPGLSLSFLPPPPRRAQAREMASPGGSETIVGGLRAVIPGTTAEKVEALPVAEAGDKGAGSVESRSGRALGGAEEQLPAEMTDMLHRYSEMMLKVVQVGDARAMDGTDADMFLGVSFIPHQPLRSGYHGPVSDSNYCMLCLVRQGYVQEMSAHPFYAWSQTFSCGAFSLIVLIRLVLRAWD